MGTFSLVLLHVIAVTALYISDYRTGFAVCEINTRRRAEACTAPLTEMLERLNLDIDQILEEPDAGSEERRSADQGRDHTKR